MKSNILLGAALVVSTYTMQSCNNTSSDSSKKVMDSSKSHMAKSGSMDDGSMQMDKSMMTSMDGMKGMMKDMKMTGDFDYDFANMMMAHHQGAVDMAKVEIAKGTNAEMKAMAQSIVAAQEVEINEFKAMLKNYKMPTEIKKEGGEMHNELAKTMDKMDATMKGVAMTGNTDKDFAMMMLPHHESAVTMAEDELSHGKNLALKKMSQKIIEEQSKEIKMFNDWLAKNK